VNRIAISTLYSGGVMMLAAGALIGDGGPPVALAIIGCGLLAAAFYRIAQ
jgi:hypothetical protein